MNSGIQLPFQNSHAFIIGINDYQHINPLSTAVNDAKVLGRELAEKHQYQVHGPLYNATKDDLIKLLHVDMPALVEIEDRVLFYFAGHGIALDSDDDPKGYLVPVDADPSDIDSLLSMDVLHKAFTSLPCQHGILIMDCCFAGAFRWSMGFRNDVVFDLPAIIYEERFYQYTRDPAWQVITSSASDQKAVDILSNRSLGLRSEGHAEHSPFALALLEGLDGEADTVPKNGGDGVITATELYTYLRDRVEDETIGQGTRQSPSMFSLTRHEKGQYIFLSPDHRLNLPPIPNRNPFMGLQSYNESDHLLFFGRDRVIAALEQITAAHRFVVVSGASGTGKSSVIKAGLLPLLRERGWQVLATLRPGKEPFQNLKREIPNMKSQLGETVPNLLIIDQYEELITQCLDPTERIRFEEKLIEWLDMYPLLRIVISIRSDFEPQFEEATFASWWKAGHYLVPAFSQEELREVIIKPSIQENLFFEPDSLVNRLVDAVNQAPGALPLLSFTLSELYYAYINSGRTNRAFTEEDYDKLGGVIGGLRTRANAIYDKYDQPHQDSMRKLMIRMVSLEGGELASRQVSSNDLVFLDGEETQRIQAVAQRLVAARLLSSGRDRDGQIYYEPAHDALVRAWARLWEWIKAQGEEKLALMYKLHLAVADYEKHRQGANATDYLWHEDPRLDLLHVDLQGKGHHFNAQEESFLQTSMGLRKRNMRRRRIILIITMLTLLGLSGAASWFGWDANERRKEVKITADSLKVTTDSLVLTNANLIQAQNEKKEADYKALMEEASKYVGELNLNAAEAIARRAIALDDLRREAALLLDSIQVMKEDKLTSDQLIRKAETVARAGNAGAYSQALRLYEQSKAIGLDVANIEAKIVDLRIVIKRNLEDRVEDADAFLRAGGDIGLKFALQNYSVADSLIVLLPEQTEERKKRIKSLKQKCQDELYKLEEHGDDD